MKEHLSAIPIMVMVLALTASVVYFCYGDVRRGIYWASTVVLYASITF